MRSIFNAYRNNRLEFLMDLSSTIAIIWGGMVAIAFMAF